MEYTVFQKYVLLSVSSQSITVYYLQSLRRSTEPSLRAREQRLAHISLLIVLIFFICHSVKNIPSMFEIFGKDARVMLNTLHSMPITITD